MDVKRSQLRPDKPIQSASCHVWFCHASEVKNLFQLYLISHQVIKPSGAVLCDNDIDTMTYWLDNVIWWRLYMMKSMHPHVNKPVTFIGTVLTCSVENHCFGVDEKKHCIQNTRDTKLCLYPLACWCEERRTGHNHGRFEYQLTPLWFFSVE